MIWRQIETFPKYEINEFGVIRNFKTKALVKQQIDKVGYLGVNLCTCDSPVRQKRIRVHRIMAQTFLPNPKKFVNHKDGNKLNNHLYNLEWVSPKENVHHAMENGLHIRGETCGHSKLKASEVLEIRSLYKKQKGIELALKFNVSPQTITDICKRRTWTHI